jgi:acetylornithine deacetylase/succinyl-diaminopimelate desuccinylase-like protein
MTSATAKHDAMIDADRERHLADYFEILRIPSVSALPAHDGDIRRAAAWVAERMKRAGIPEIEIVETGGKPLVWGRWHVSDDQPTAMIYAHYDVQPPDPLGLWTSPPFEPVLVEDKVFARGSNDDKGGLLLSIIAVETLAKIDGKPPINLVFFFEGEEEIGSPSVAPFIKANLDHFRCDWILSADGLMQASDQYSLTVSTKGMAACEIHVRTAGTDMHSGVYGAFMGNAARSIAEIVASLHTPDGKVAVEGFYDRVIEITPQEREEIARVEFDEPGILKQLGATELWGETGYTPWERAWLRPTLDINGIYGGFQGDGKKTVTPAEAHAKITCRLVSDQDPAEIVELIAKHVAKHTPAGAVATVERAPGGSKAFAISRDNEALVAAGKVLKELTGAEPLIIRTGGTLPIAETFQTELGAELVFFGFGTLDGNAHAPNEWQRLSDFFGGAKAYCALLTELAR